MMEAETLRATLLQALIHSPSNASQVMPALAELGWDFSAPPVRMTLEDLRTALHQYIQGQISAQDIEFWSNCIEGREDLDYEHNYRDLMAQTVFELANPELTYSLSSARASALLEHLSKT
jgi:hypothetical protein